jgi:hypothetical protein
MAAREKRTPMAMPMMRATVVVGEVISHDISSNIYGHPFAVVGEAEPTKLSALIHIIHRPY